MALIPSYGKRTQQPRGLVALQPGLSAYQCRGIIAGQRDAVGAYAPTVQTALLSGDSVLAHRLTGSDGYVTGVGVAGTGAWTILAFGFLRSSGASAIASVAESPGASTWDRSLLIGAAGAVIAYTYDGMPRPATTSDAPLVGRPFVAAAVCTGSTLVPYLNGVRGTGVAVSNAGYTGYSSPELVIGYGGGAAGVDGGSQTLASRFDAYYVLMFQGAVPDAVLAEIGSDGWAIFEPQQIWVPSASSGGGAAVANATVPVTATTPAGVQTHQGAVANGTVALTSSAPAGTQTHQGAVTSAAVALAASAPAGVQTHQGAVANTSVAVTASIPAGTQTHQGAVAGAALPLAATAPAGVQTHQGAVANATITTTASTVAGSGSGTGVVSNAAIPVTASSPAGTQTHQGAVSGASVWVDAQAVAGVQTHRGAVANASVLLAASTVAGSVGGYNGAVSSAAVAVVAGSVAGLQTHVGALSGATISLTAVAPAGVQEHQGAVSSSTVSLQASAVAGGVSYNGVVASALIAVSASNPVGTQVHQGAVSNVIIPVLASVAGPVLGLPLTVSAMRTYLVPVDQPGDLYGPYYRPTPPTWTHEPSARLDYAVDWVDWLADGGDTIDTVDARVVNPILGLNITTFDKRNDTQVAAMVVPTDTNNLPEPGTAVDVTFRITTNNLRADERTVTLVIQER